MITCTYKIPRGIATIFNSDEIHIKEAILLAEDLEKTGRVKHLTFEDQHRQSWTLKELKKLTKEVQTEPHDITIYFDGGFDVKTKQSGLACVIYYEQNDQRYRIRKNIRTEGLTSNNEAEYAALHLGVKELELLNVQHLPVTCIGDSMVVINQIGGDWACYEENFLAWIDRIEAQMNSLGIKPTYQLIPRQENKEADRLATQALKGVEISSTKALESLG